MSRDGGLAWRGLERALCAQGRRRPERVTGTLRLDGHHCLAPSASTSSARCGRRWNGPGGPWHRLVSPAELRGRPPAAGPNSAGAPSPELPAGYIAPDARAAPLVCHAIAPKDGALVPSSGAYSEVLALADHGATAAADGHRPNACSNRRPVRSAVRAGRQPSHPPRRRSPRSQAPPAADARRVHAASRARTRAA